MSSRSIPAVSVGGRWMGSGLRCTALGLSAALALTACNKAPDSAAVAPAAAQAQSAVQQPVAYQPPPAEVLYRMVAPIALYPDKLVAQVLAASTYPDQVSAAETWLAQNPGLKAAEQASAVNDQPWDPAVKSLTQFPNVLEQLAANLPWTTALGQAYYHDPGDVMNAIQVMRGRAYSAGTLKSSDRQQVRVAAQPPVQQDYVPAPDAPALPMPAPVIQAPPQYIEIAPSTVGSVYVPQYNPAVVYGAPLPVYAGYSYVVPPPMAVGLIGFGAAVVLVQPAWYRPWGWHAWGMHWGEPGRRWYAGAPPLPPAARPAVIYNNTTYVSRSTTVVNNQVNINQARLQPLAGAQPMPAGPQHGALGAAAVAGAAAAGAHAFAMRPQWREPAAMQGGLGLKPQQLPSGLPPRAGSLPQAGQGRPAGQAPAQGAAFAQRPMAVPTQRREAGAPVFAAQPMAGNAVPAPHAGPGLAPHPAMPAPPPRMLQQEQARMRMQGPQQVQQQAPPHAQYQAQQAQAQQRAREQAQLQQQQQAQLAAQQRAREQAQQQAQWAAGQRAREQAQLQAQQQAQFAAQQRVREQQQMAAVQQARAQQEFQQRQQMQQRQEMQQRQVMQQQAQQYERQQRMAAAPMRARESYAPGQGGQAHHPGHWR